MNKLKKRSVMSEKLRFISGFFAMLVLIISCSSSKVQNGINGGFENNDYGSEDPDGWFANRLPQTEKYAELKIENETVHSGNESVSIAISKSHPPRQTVYNWVKRVDGLKASEIYELEGWIKTREIKNSPFIEVQCWNNRGNKLIGRVSTENKYRITGTRNWQLVKTIFEIPKETTKVLILARVGSYENNGGKVWFDDIQLKRFK